MSEKEKEQQKQASGRKSSDKKAEARKKAKPKKPVNPLRVWGRRLTWSLISLAVVLAIAGGVTALVGYHYFAQDLPPVESLKNYRPKTVTFFYSDDGRVIGEYSHERRIVVPLAKIPEHVREAFIAAEDKTFYSHPGVDFKSILRAAVANLEAGEIKEGASTIPMQVARTFFLSREKKFARKIREGILAMRMTSNLSKDEILYLYLNQINLGHGAHGVESAAELYFDKHVDQLTIAEAAQLAGMPVAPSKYSPYINPKAARMRQLYVIGQMKENGFITPEEAEAAVAEQLHLYDRPNVNITLTPYFTEHVRRILEKKFGEESLYNDGYKVYTSVNIEMQAAARAAVGRGLREFAKRRPFRGPEKQLKPEEIEAYIKEQTERLGGRPPELMEKEQEALVTEADTKANKLKVRIGPHEGVIEKADLLWILGHGKPLSQLIAAGDVILVADQGEGRRGQGQKAEKRYRGRMPDPFHPGTASSTPNRRSSAWINKDGGVKAMIGGRSFAWRASTTGPFRPSGSPGPRPSRPSLYTAALSQRVHAGLGAHRFSDRIRRFRPQPTLETHQFRPQILRPHRPCTTGWSIPATSWPSSCSDLVGYPASVIETARKTGHHLALWPRT